MVGEADGDTVETRELSIRENLVALRIAMGRPGFHARAGALVEAKLRELVELEPVAEMLRAPLPQA